MTASIRSFTRTSDNMGNISYHYGPTMWESSDPSDLELHLALSIIKNRPGTMLFFDEQPITSHSPRRIERLAGLMEAAR